MNSTSSENSISIEIISEKDTMSSNKETITTTTTTTEKANTSQIEKMPWPAFSEVFLFQPTSGKENKLAFKCKFCVGGKIKHANKTSSANFKKHINVSYIF